MRKNKTLTFVLLSAVVLSANAFVIDWNKIVHWAGSGNNKAAMVVQFADNGDSEGVVRLDTVHAVYGNNGQHGVRYRIFRRTYNFRFP